MKARLVALWLSLAAAPAAAGWTETLPRGVFLLDESFTWSVLENRFDDRGRATTLIDSVRLYEPGSGLQGVLEPRARVDYLILINQLQYGVLDNLSVGVGVPVVVSTRVDLDLRWTPGDYQQFLGRAYSEEDFWQWAESMGQPRPEDWRGNRGVLSDIVLGARWRFSDHLEAWRKSGLRAALLALGALPTGSPPPEEEIAGAGTTMWDLHSQGELGAHLALERTFRDRFTLGVDVFYEAFFRHRYRTPQGTKNPLLLRASPYAGDTYTIDPGDFVGLAVALEAVVFRGPARASWLSRGDTGLAEKFPPLLILSAEYRFTHLGQSDWSSESAIWDYEKEKLWRPGHKNTLWLRASASLLRLGLPLAVYVAWRNQSWLGGRNMRAADVLVGGVQLFASLW